MKPKVFIANNVLLHGVPDEHRAANGCRQFFVVCKTTSKKRLAYLIGNKVSDLNNYGCRAVDDIRFAQNAGAVDEVRYEVRHTTNEGALGWHTWVRPDWLNKRDPLESIT